MTKATFLFLIFLLSDPSSRSTAQVQFTDHRITGLASGAHSVHGVDVDGDGDMDVLSASSNDHKIAWYENDGQESFTTHTITTNAQLAWSVSAEDMDGDGDTDVVSASLGQGEITWYENDGNENFTSHHFARVGEGEIDIYVIDLDDDGDRDVLSASDGNNSLEWYENDGDGNFIRHTIATGRFQTVHAIDMDGDDDIDVVSGSNSEERIEWYENDGNEDFTTRIVATTVLANSVYAVDVDGDKDIDVLSAYGSVHWHENDGSGNFTLNTITSDIVSPRPVFAADIDADGDIDPIAGGSWVIEWYEYRGKDDFTPHAVAGPLNVCYSIFAVDLDGDGDEDVLSTSYGHNEISWHENNILDPPTAPALVSPDSGAIITTDSVTFVWHKSSPEDNFYWLEGATDSLFSNPFIDSTLTDTTAIVAPLHHGQTYWWKVKVQNENGWGPFSDVWGFSVLLTEVDEDDLPTTEFFLDQNYPNPFNSISNFQFRIGNLSDVRLTIYDLLGQEISTIAEERLTSGTYTRRWDAAGQPSGVYFYRLRARHTDGGQAGEFVETRKLLLAK